MPTDEEKLWALMQRAIATWEAAGNLIEHIRKQALPVLRGEVVTLTPEIRAEQIAKVDALMPAVSEEGAKVPTTFAAYEPDPGDLPPKEVEP